MTNPMRAYNQRALLSSKYPREINLETTNLCNLRCISCPQRGEMTRKRGFMKFDLFKKIIDEASGNVRNIQLHLFGEPLLHPDINKQLEYAYKKGINLGVFTNAGLLTKDKAEALAKYASRVIISFNGSTKKTYECIQVGSNFEQTSEKIKYFLNYVREHGRCRVKLKFLQMKENYDEAEGFLKEWKKYSGKGINVSVVKEHDWAGQLENLPSWKDGAQKRHPCFLLWKMMAIGWNGDVGVCCYDFNFPYILGNLNKQKIVDVWNGEKYRKLREIHTKGEFGKLSLCKNCTSWSLYPEKFGFKHIAKSSIYSRLYKVINKFSSFDVQ